MTAYTESVVEQANLAWLESIDWVVRNGAEIAPGEMAAERTDYAMSCWRNGFTMARYTACLWMV